jgi:Uncharacterized protein involved in propionate catabolism
VPRRIKLKPANLTVSQWSLPFCLAVAIMDGHLLNPAEQLSQERLNDARTLELAQRIKGELKEELDGIIEQKHILRSPFKLKLKNGKEYEAATDCKGFPSNPLSEEEIDFKFNTLVSRVLSKEKTASLYSLLNKIEELEDVSQLAGSISAQ